jgi:hypothetical protein
VKSRIFARSWQVPASGLERQYLLIILYFLTGSPMSETARRLAAYLTGLFLDHGHRLRLAANYRF